MTSKGVREPKSRHCSARWLYRKEGCQKGNDIFRGRHVCKVPWCRACAPPRDPPSAPHYHPQCRTPRRPSQMSPCGSPAKGVGGLFQQTENTFSLQIILFQHYFASTRSGIRSGREGNTGNFRNGSCLKHEAVAQHDQGDRGIKIMQKGFDTTQTIAKTAPTRFVDSPGQAEVISLITWLYLLSLISTSSSPDLAMMLFHWSRLMNADASMVPRSQMTRGRFTYDIYSAWRMSRSPFAEKGRGS